MNIGESSANRGQKNQTIISSEIISAEVNLSANNGYASQIGSLRFDSALTAVDQELERFVNHANRADYAFAIACGLLSGVLDALLVGQINISEKDIALSHEQVNKFIERYADKRGLKGRHLKNSISNLEIAFPVLQDNVWKGADIGVSAKNHHLADLAHHPTLLGLVSAITVQLLRVGTFVSRDGQWHFQPIHTSAKDWIKVLAPAVITGFLNWLIIIGEKKYEEAADKELPEYVRKLAHIAASVPFFIEIARCADNWFGHLVSDMGGSKQTADGGMGIPGILVSMLHELAALPLLKDSGLPQVIDKLYTKQRLDLRHEIPLYKELGKQTIPVLVNELFVRLSYFIIRLANEISIHNGVRDINWNTVIPFGNRTVDRMLTVASLTFTIADSADAAIHAAIESGGNWVLFAGKFVTRFNYIGAGRAALAVIKEISNEQKEAQLVHEKRILSEQRTDVVIQQLQQYKSEMENLVSSYLAEDIEAFIAGFDYMLQGVEKDDSDLVIRGNVVIQRVLGRSPQFSSQQEFDAFMESDIPLQL